MNKTNLRLAAAVAALLCAAFLVFYLRDDSPSKTSAATSPAIDVAPPATPKRITHQESSTQSARPSPEPPTRDDDPIGDIRLEGQVIDEDGAGVAGALVVLGSAPPRNVTSEEDGSFAFENLVGRRYSVHARSENLVGGPVMATPSEQSDPVIVRMKPGGGIAVEVVDSENRPVSGATVSVPSLHSMAETTNTDGIATLQNLPPGPTMMSASASGFATMHSLVSVPGGADAKGRGRIVLPRGTLLAGTVVDHRGNPVENASVVARGAGNFMRAQAPKRDGVRTDAKGQFQLVVAQGSMQLFAVHEDHAPTTSERISVGDTEIRDVKLTLREGATIAGRVFGADGAPVAWPTIHVVGDAIGGRGIHRQSIGDKDGQFEIRGLPREKLLVSASSSEASSPSQEVDVRSRASAKNLSITLDVIGTISGTVTDEHGEPVAEAQVQAVPDFWEGADLNELRVRGPAFATSAGDGSFTVRGLPDSKYTIRAMRGSQGQGAFGQGTSAKTGDADVRVVLATPGSLEGRITMEDGSAPAIAMVSVGWGQAVPAVKGSFVIQDVAPGTYELRVRGPQFATTYVPDIEIEAGGRHDLGTISVQQGRVLRGTVTNSAGRAIAGAEVVMASQIISDGASLTPKNFGTGMDDRIGIRRATSDDAGHFVLNGLGTGTSTLVADHAAHGRSLGIEIPKGNDDLDVELKLRDVGSVRGTVRVNGAPVADVQVLITSTEGAAHIVVVSSDERGKFFAERVVAGQQKVSAMLNAAGKGSMAATIVTVEANQETEADLTIEEGSVTLKVQVKGIDDAVIDAAQIFLFKGKVDVQTGGELNALFLKAAADAKMTFAFGSQETKFEKIVAGPHSVCVIPINGDMNDPAFAQKLQRHVGEIAVYCQPIDIAASPEVQSHTAIVAPMQPLPEED